MDELTDDQLDGLFRKSAEEFEPEFDAAAWQAMQQQLNDRDRTLLWGKLLRWGLPILALLLVTGSSWFVYKNQSFKPGATAALEGNLQTNEVPAATGDTDQPARSVKPSHKQALPIQRAPHQPKTSPASALTGLKPSVGAHIEKVKKTMLGQPTQFATRRSNVAPDDAASLPTPFAQSVARLSESDRSHRTASRQIAVSAFFPQTETTPATYVNSATIGTNDGIPQPDPLPQEAAWPIPLAGLDTLANKPATWPSADALSHHEVTQAAIETPQTTASSVRQTGLSVRLLVSPDLSSVGLNDFQRPGTNLGALLEYQFAARWRVQAGVIRSVKVYKSSAARYEWGSYTWPVQPESVYGRCNMLDIPLNLRYDILLQPRPDGRQNRWFVNGGFTTYVLLREDYTYNYANPDDPRINARAREWSTNTGGYGFSHLNASFGYEGAFGKRLSWQIEPFVKVPLRGVGYYKLNLLSTGAFLSLRYTIR